MAVGELIIDDDYVKSMGRFYRAMGNNIDQMIEDYILKLQEIKTSSIMEGDIAEALNSYITSAQALKEKAGDMGNEMKDLVNNFIADIDDADQFLF